MKPPPMGKNQNSLVKVRAVLPGKVKLLSSPKAGPRHKPTSEARDAVRGHQLQMDRVKDKARLPVRTKVRRKVNPISKPPAPDKAKGGEKGSRNPASRKGRDRLAAKGKAKDVGKASQAVNAKPPKLTVRAKATLSPHPTAAATARPGDAAARPHR